MKPEIPDILAPEPEKRYRQTRNRCSSIGHPCPMTTWFARSALWEGRKPLDDGLARIFRVGRLWETFVGAELRRAGMIRAEESLEWPEYNLAGMMDGMFDKPDRTVVDLKSMAEHSFDGINDVEDLRNGTAYQRCYIPQVSLYGSHPRVNARFGALYLVAKSSGRVKVISWPLASALAHDAVETALSNCKRINAALAESDSDKDSAAFDLAQPGPWCDGCDWAHLCPSFSAQACGWRLAPEIVEQLVMEIQSLKAEIKPKEAEIEKLEKELKSHWSSAGPGTYVAGQWVAKVTEVPACEVKASSRPAYLRTTYKRLHAAEE